MARTTFTKAVDFNNNGQTCWLRVNFLPVCTKIGLGGVKSGVWVKKIIVCMYCRSLKIYQIVTLVGCHLARGAFT